MRAYVLHRMKATFEIVIHIFTYSHEKLLLTQEITIYIGSYYLYE
jgi:hypothetical protein